VTIRVLVADDQAVVRQGVVLLLSTSGDIEVAGEASDGQEALRLTLDLKPDVALVDLRMPGLDGAPVTKRMRKRLPTTRGQAREAFCHGCDGESEAT